MDINLLILSFALGMQLISVYFAIRLLRFAEKRVIAIVFILVASLMALRRMISLVWFFSQDAVKIDLVMEVVGLCISFLILYGIISIARIFRSEEENKNAAASSELRYRTLFDQSPDGVILINKKGDIIDFNKKVHQQLGYTREEFSKLRISDIDFFESPTDVKARLEKILKDGKAEFEVKHITKQGEIRDVLVIVQTLELSGQTFLHGIWRDITESKQIEAEKEQFYKFFQTSADLMVIADPKGAFMKTNPACTETLGYSEIELVSKPFVEFVHPEDKQATLDEMARQLQKGISLNFENRYICKDGSFRWLSWRAIYNKEDNTTYATARDITERKRAEDSLRKSEKFIENILSSVDEAFVVIDREYRIIAANRAYCEQAEMSWEKVIGRHCYEVSHHATLPCQEPDHVCAFKHTLETGEPGFAVHTHTDEHGKQRQTDIRTYAMKDESGEIQSVIEVIIDVTEKKALENQLRHAQKMESIGTLAGGIAHDFNNILSAIIGYGHVTLMKMPTDDPLRLNIEHMLESADRAAALTKSLLTFSRKQITDRKPISVNNILTKLEKFLVRVIGEDVSVQLVLAEGELTVMADEGQLEQVFMNLATNARDAMPHGGLFIIETSIMEMDREFISTHPYGKPGTYAMISATDTGVGMTDETIKKIFEPFFTTKEIGKGTGLGLAMVYGILKQNEGFINVYSEPGKGTTFLIYLPLIKTAGMEGRKSFDISYPKGGTETILLAEDDVKLRQLIVIVLEQMGYTVITAENGDDAVAKFRENKDRIQLLLFDIMMPKKGGIEAYEEIMKVMPKVSVLFASGYSSDMLSEKALIKEGAIVISKPMSPQNLLKKVREVLDHRNYTDDHGK